MKKITNPTSFLYRFRSVFSQLLFVWLTFFIMVISSYLFVQKIVRDYLAKEAENTLSYTQYRISTDLREAETILQTVSQSILLLILRGDSADAILQHMTETTNYLSNNNVRVSGFDGIYGFFDVFGGLFLDGTGWIPPEDYMPQERPWYTAAIEADGDITATTPYVSLYPGVSVISFTRQIIDNSGRQLGVVSLDLRLDKMADYIVNMRLTEFCYGILLSEKMEFIATPSTDFIGRHLSEFPYKSIHKIVNELENNIKIFEYGLIDDRSGIEYVMFSRKIENGWNLGILIPVNIYYRNVTVMRIFISVLGVVLAYLLSFTLYRIAAAKQKAEKKSFNLERTLIKTMAELVEYRDDDTGGHIDRTQRGIKILVEEVKKSGFYKEETENWDIDLLTQSSQLHDIGKIYIEDRILKKPGKLDETEFNEIKKHTEFGEQIILKIETMTEENEFLKYAKIFAVSHHEKWDGTGYPKGLKENEIPLLGRIMAIADVYDALVSERPYKKAFTHEDAVNEIAKGKGKHFDPFLIDLFLAVSDNFKKLVN